MKKVEVVVSFIKHLVWTLILEGVLVFIMGILILVYPDLLGMLVGLLLIVSAFWAFIMAYRINKLSTFKFEI